LFDCSSLALEFGSLIFNKLYEAIGPLNTRQAGARRSLSFHGCHIIFFPVIDVAFESSTDLPQVEAFSHKGSFQTERI
jgi:hypothetical protein